MKIFILLMLIILAVPVDGDVGKEDFDRAEKSIHERGGGADRSVRDKERSSVREASKSVEKEYHDKGYEGGKAAAIAKEKTLGAWIDLRDPKHGRDSKSPVGKEEIVSYASRLGRVTIKSTPTGALIMIDSQPAGTTETNKWLTEGGHKIEIALEGYESQEKSVTAKAGTNQTIEAKLLKKP
jgi:PEGA domain